jgi:hypothetical protein
MPAGSAVDVGQFNPFFVENLCMERSSICDSTPHEFIYVRFGDALFYFKQLKVKVVNEIRRPPDELTATDPMPTPLLKLAADLAEPLIVKVIN